VGAPGFDASPLGTLLPVPPTRSAARTTFAATCAAALLIPAGCSTGDDGSLDSGPDRGTDTPAGETAATWSSSTDPVRAGGLVWAADGVVHLGDGTTIDVGGPMTTYVVAGDGVYFTPAGSGEDGTEHSNVTTAPLRFADSDGTVTETGLTVYVESLGSSEDRRYLGLVDATSGPEDSFSDTPLATAVVYDLASGERVVDTTDGMGDPDEDDLAHDYQEVYLGVRFPVADSALVEGLDDTRRYALPAGEGEVVDPVDAGIRDPSDPISPDGTWAIEDRGFGDRVVEADGEAVRLRIGAPRWDLRWWLDEATVVGVAVSGPGTGTKIVADDRVALMTCQVPDGACGTVEETTGMALRFPVGSGEESLDLPNGDDAR
jgi:hypothetical protein